MLWHGRKPQRRWCIARRTARWPAQLELGPAHTLQHCFISASWVGGRRRLHLASQCCCAHPNQRCVMSGQLTLVPPRGSWTRGNYLNPGGHAGMGQASPGTRQKVECVAVGYSWCLLRWLGVSGGCAASIASTGKAVIAPPPPPGVAPLAAVLPWWPLPARLLHCAPNQGMAPEMAAAEGAQRRRKWSPGRPCTCPHSLQAVMGSWGGVPNLLGIAPS